MAIPFRSHISFDILTRKLLHLGYLTDTNCDHKKLQEAVRSYQEFHGLDPDGIVGEYTTREFSRPRCGLPDIPAIKQVGVCKWPQKEIFWNADNVLLSQLAAAKVKTAFDQAFAMWADVADLRPMYAAPGSRINILARSGSGRLDGLDGRGGTLAWSELPCGVKSTAQLRQMYDKLENWDYDMLVLVAAHEIGHALGIDHLPNGNIMAPVFNRNVKELQSNDIQEIIKRYGRKPSITPAQPTPEPSLPETPAAPVPPPEDPTKIVVTGTILINGKPYILRPM